jgi:dTDP-4-dehydrorhamnose reductase
MPDTKKILILGGSSFVGSCFFSLVGPSGAVATFCSHPIEKGVYFDALKMQLSDIIANPQYFSHAIILLGNTDPDSCARDVAGSTYLNVFCIQRILEQLKIFRIIPVFISTEAVFDGKKGDYVETDPINPILTYGQQKGQIEDHIKKTVEKFIIVRLARVFGSHRADGTLFTSWLDQIQRNDNIYCARDQIFSPIHVDEVCEGLIRLIKNDCEGVFHLSNNDGYSRLDMLKLTLRCYREYAHESVKIIERNLDEFPALEKRPLNISMRPDKIIKATGVQLRSLDFHCSKIVKRWFKDGIKNMAV